VRRDFTLRNLRGELADLPLFVAEFESGRLLGNFDVSRPG